MARVTWVAALASSALTAIVVGGVAVAASSPSKATYQACADSKRVLHTLVASTGKCASGETPVTWVAQGPRHAEVSEQEWVPGGAYGQTGSCPIGWVFPDSGPGPCSTAPTAYTVASAVGIAGASYPSSAQYHWRITFVDDSGVSDCFRLYDLTAGAPVANSTTCTTGTGTWAKQVSGAFTLPAAIHTYSMQAQSTTLTNGQLESTPRVLIDW